MIFRAIVFAGLLAAVAEATEQALPADGCLQLDAVEYKPACALSVSAPILLDVALRRGGCAGPLLDGQIWSSVQGLDADVDLPGGAVVAITSHYAEDQAVMVTYSLACKAAPGDILAGTLLWFVGLSLMCTALAWCRVRAIRHAAAPPGGYAPVRACAA